MGENKQVKCKCGKTYSINYVRANDKVVHTIAGWKTSFLGSYRDGRLIALNGCPECISAREV